MSWSFHYTISVIKKFLSIISYPLIMARKQSLTKIKRKNSRLNQMRNKEKSKIVREWQKDTKKSRKDRGTIENKENIKQTNISSKMKNQRNKKGKHKNHGKEFSSESNGYPNDSQISDHHNSTGHIRLQEKGKKDKLTYGIPIDPVETKEYDKLTSDTSKGHIDSRKKDKSTYKKSVDHIESRRKDNRNIFKKDPVHNQLSYKEHHSKLKDLFYSDLDEKEILDNLEFLKDKEALAQEISYFGHLVNDLEYDKALVVFFVENISKYCVKKNMVTFLTICFRLFENIDMKKSIFILKLLMVLTKLDSFVPVTVQLIKIYKIADKHDCSSSTDKNIDYNRLKLSTDVLQSVQLREFVLEESLALLFANLNSISNCLGFPEFAEPVICSLKEIVTDDHFDLKDFLNRIQSQINLIKTKRTGLSIVCHEDLVEFEKSTAKMIE